MNPESPTGTTDREGKEEYRSGGKGADPHWDRSKAAVGDTAAKQMLSWLGI